MTAARQTENRPIKTGALQDAIFTAPTSRASRPTNTGSSRSSTSAPSGCWATRRSTWSPHHSGRHLRPQEIIARAAALSAELDTTITPGSRRSSQGQARHRGLYGVTYVRKDGSRFPAMFSVTSLRDADDHIIGYLLIGTDNTAARRSSHAGALDQQLRDQQSTHGHDRVEHRRADDHRHPGNHLRRHQQMVTLTGFERSELIGAPCVTSSPIRCVPTSPSNGPHRAQVTDYELTVRPRTREETVVSYNAATFHDADGTRRASSPPHAT